MPASVALIPNRRSHLADLLRRDKNVILQRWEARVRQVLEAAKSTDPLTLRDAIPHFLDRLADQVEVRPVSKPVTVHTDASQIHGEQRAEQTGYSLEEVIREYFILRRVTFEVIEEEGGPIPSEERDLVLRSFEDAISDAATAFVRMQLERLRAEQSRYESLTKEGESREQFINLLTHDLKNPLAAARLSADLLERQQSQSSGARALVHRIRENVARVERMVSDLLDIGRIKAGKPLILKYEPFDLSEAIQRVVQDFSVVYGNRFVVNGPISMPGFWGREALRRALENLLSNAVKYGESARPVSISFGADGADVFISVQNWGRPIPPDEIPHLFRPYQRSIEAEQGGRLGWGLGLIQVKATAEAHRGSVQVESSAERGTTFTLRFPLAQAKEES